jgi:hypothetical protein
MNQVDCIRPTLAVGLMQSTWKHYSYFWLLLLAFRQFLALFYAFSIYDDA